MSICFESVESVSGLVLLPYVVRHGSVLYHAGNLLFVWRVVVVGHWSYCLNLRAQQ